MVFERCKELVVPPLTLLPEYDWIAQIKRLHSGGQSLPAAPLIEGLFLMDRDSFQEHKRELDAKRVQVDFNRTRLDLELADFSIPPLDDHSLRKFLGWMLTTDEELSRSVSARASDPSNRRYA